MPRVRTQRDLQLQRDTPRSLARALVRADRGRRRKPPHRRCCDGSGACRRRHSRLHGMICTMSLATSADRRVRSGSWCRSHRPWHGCPLPECAHRYGSYCRWLRQPGPERSRWYRPMAAAGARRQRHGKPGRRFRQRRARHCFSFARGRRCRIFPLHSPSRCPRLIPAMRLAELLHAISSWL